MTDSNESNITCGACTVAIGAHTFDENCREEKKTVAVYHLTGLTRDERMKLNRGGWDSSPRFSRYADITAGFSKVLASQAIEAWNLGEYHLAATVETSSKDWAYQQTNNISHVWSLNDEVEAHTDEFKSTSVGDIMIDSDGQAWIVAPVGFEKIDLPEPSHFYATCVFGWATSEISVDDCIERLALRFRSDVQRIIRSEKKDGKPGMYFWSCRVLADADAPYKIEWFQPVGVECVETQEHAVTRCTLKVIEHHVTTGENS